MKIRVHILLAICKFISQEIVKLQRRELNYGRE